MIWFKGFKWIKENIDLKSKYVVYGKINWFDNRPTIAHPELTKINNYNIKNISGIYPIYSSTEKTLRYGITQKVIRDLSPQQGSVLPLGNAIENKRRNSKDNE